MPLSAQAGAAGNRKAPPPAVRNLDFVGVSHLDTDELRSSIATEESSCNSILLRFTVCPFTHSPAVYTTRRLDRTELARDVLRLRAYYWRRGFRETQVDTVVQPLAGDRVDVTFVVTEGEPTVTDTVIVSGADSVLSPGALRRLLELKPGEPLSLPALDSSIAMLRNALADEGYADAVVDTGIAVAPDERRAAVRIDVDPRWLTTVGAIRVRGLEQLDPGTVRNSITLHRGDIYRRKEALRSQRNLYESAIFQRANIEVQGDSAVKAVTVTVKEGDLHTARLAAGFNTVDYAQVDGRYTDYNFLGGARRLQMQITLGNLLASALEDEFIFRKLSVSDDFSGDRGPFLKPNWQASAELRQPWIWDPRNTAAISVFAHRRSIPGIVVDRGQGANLSFTRRVAARIDVSTSYRFEVTRVEAGGVYFCVNFGVCDPATIDAIASPRKLSPLSLSATADRSDDPLEPQHGWSASGSLEHASRFTASDFAYNRATLEGAAYRPVAGGTLAGHVRLGWSQALSNESLNIPGLGDVAVLHPRKRFYAGGSRSVRGYGENQLGPRILTISASKLEAIGCTPPFDQCTDLTALDTAGTQILSDNDFTPRPIGGSAVAEANLEYRFPIWGQLLGAAFVDGAILTSTDNGLLTLKDNFMAVTPGFGIRYRSPVGPIRVDLGWKPEIRGPGGSGEGLPVLTEVTTDGTRRIVRVGSGVPADQRPLWRYGPGAGTTGGFLSRFALHLSIGEAF